MEEKINALDKFYTLLQKIVSTKFGSAVVGFTLCGLIAYYSFMQRCAENVHSLQNELIYKKRANDSLRNKLVNIREEEREKAKVEQREYFDYIYKHNQKIQTEIEQKNVRKTQEIKKLEEEIERRKEL